MVGEPDASIAFLGVGALGWGTMADVLAVRYVDSGVMVANLFAPGSRALSSPTPVQSMVREMATATDVRFRTRRQRLAKWLDANPAIRHVHCFGHLVAVPDEFERRGITYSVSCDEAWKWSTGTVHKPVSRRDQRRCERRVNAEKAVFDSARMISCVSEWASVSVASCYPNAAGKLHIHPFPVMSPSAGVRKAEPFRITFIGNDFERKGGDRLLRWFADSWSQNHQLHVVTSALRPSAAERIPNVHWHGRVANSTIRDQILPSTAVLVLPTAADLSPLVLTEAAAAGVPAVASKIAGIPELVLHERTGFTPDHDDDAGFIAAISSLLGDRELNREMGLAARSHYVRNLDSERSTDDLLQMVLRAAE